MSLIQLSGPEARAGGPDGVEGLVVHDGPLKVQHQQTGKTQQKLNKEVYKKEICNNFLFFNC